MRAKVEAHLKAKDQTLEGVDSAQRWNELRVGYQNAAVGKYDDHMACYFYEQGLKLDGDHG